MEYTANMKFQHSRGVLKLSPADGRRLTVLYDAGVAELDDRLGVLLRKIGKLGLEKNTVIIVTSDHGEELGERQDYGLHSHTVYDELLRVPWIIRAPRGLTAGHIDRQVSLVDLTPTTLGLLGLPVQAGLDGVDQLDQSPGPGRATYAETSLDRQQLIARLDTAFERIKANAFLPHRRPWFYKVRKIRMVRKEGFKLISNPDGSFEMYNLANDPGEKRNLIGSLPPLEKSLRESLETFR